MEKLKSKISEFFKAVPSSEWQTAVLMIFLTAAVIVLIRYGSLIIGNVGEWTWGKQNLALGGRTVWYLVFGVFYLIFCYFALKRNLRPAILLPLAIASSVILMLLVLSFRGDWITLLGGMIRHTGITSYFADAPPAGELRGFLSNYSGHLGSLHLHSQTHPPGPIVFFYFIKQLAYSLANFIVIDPAKLSGLVLVFAASLTVVPLYYLIRNFESKIAPTAGVLLCAIYPSLILFTVEFDQVYPLLFTTIILLYVLGMKKCHALYFVLSGLLLAVSLYFSFLFLAVPLLLLILVILLFFKRSEKTAAYFKATNFITLNAILAISFLAANILYQVFGGENLYSVYCGTMIYHHLFLSSMSYQPWLFFNLLDFGLFLGVPIALALILAFGESFYRLINQKKISTLFWLFFLFIVILDLLGKNRGETARIWMFVGPLALAGVSGWFARLEKGKAMAFLTVFLVLVQILMFNKYLILIGLS